VNRLSRVIAAAVVGSLSVAAVFGQSEKINLRMAPAPDQTVRVTMAQDMDIDVTFEGAPALPGLAGPIRMVIRTTMTMTQKVGPRKPDGSVDAAMTYDQIKTDMSMNGQSLPTGNDAGQLTNLTVTATYNRNGELVDIKGLPVAGVLTADSFKQMMGSFYGNLPAQPIGVGESVTTPVELALPLPLPGGAPMKMVSTTNTKLVSLENSAAGRSARLEASTDGKMAGDMAAPDGKSRMQFDFVLSGGGATVIDLARGVLRSSVTTINMNGTIGMGNGTPPGLPPMRMRATVTNTMASE